MQLRKHPEFLQGKPSRLSAQDSIRQSNLWTTVSLQNGKFRQRCLRDRSWPLDFPDPKSPRSWTARPSGWDSGL